MSIINAVPAAGEGNAALAAAASAATTTGP